jgi:hypothetical protein
MGCQSENAITTAPSGLKPKSILPRDSSSTLTFALPQLSNVSSKIGGEVTRNGLEIETSTLSVFLTEKGCSGPRLDPKEPGSRGGSGGLMSSFLGSATAKTSKDCQSLTDSVSFCQGVA